MRRKLEALEPRLLLDGDGVDPSIELTDIDSDFDDAVAYVAFETGPLVDCGAFDGPVDFETIYAETVGQPTESSTDLIQSQIVVTTSDDGGSTIVDDGSVVADDGSVVADDGSVVVDDGAVVIDDGSVEVDHGSVEVDDNSVVVDDGSVTVDDDGSVDDNGSVIEDGVAVEITHPCLLFYQIASTAELTDIQTLGGGVDQIGGGFDQIVLSPGDTFEFSDSDGEMVHVQFLGRRGTATLTFSGSTADGSDLDSVVIDGVRRGGRLIIESDGNADVGSLAIMNSGNFNRSTRGFRFVDIDGNLGSFTSDVRVRNLFVDGELGLLDMPQLSIERLFAGVFDELLANVASIHDLRFHSSRIELTEPAIDSSRLAFDPDRDPSDIPENA